MENAYRINLLMNSSGVCAPFSFLYLIKRAHDFHHVFLYLYLGHENNVKEWMYLRKAFCFSSWYFVAVIHHAVYLEYVILNSRLTTHQSKQILLLLMEFFEDHSRLTWWLIDEKNNSNKKKPDKNCNFNSNCSFYNLFLRFLVRFWLSCIKIMIYDAQE